MSAPSTDLLTEKVQFLEPQVTRDQYGSQQTAWTRVGTYHARVTWLRGQRALNVGEVWIANAIAISMRWNEHVHDHQRIVWQGKTYQVDSWNGSRHDGGLNITASLVEE